MAKWIIEHDREGCDEGKTLDYHMNHWTLIYHFLSRVTSFSPISAVRNCKPNFVGLISSFGDSLINVEICITNVVCI